MSDYHADVIRKAKAMDTIQRLFIGDSDAELRMRPDRVSGVRLFTVSFREFRPGDKLEMAQGTSPLSAIEALSAKIGSSP